MIKTCFPAVADADTRVLVLGSLPGERSLSRTQYYAHPQNQFWRLMGAVTGTDIASLDYPGRLDALRAAHVGLWDVIGSAERRGSLDAAIRDHQANDLGGFVATLPGLRAVAFNGGKAAAIGRRLLEGAGGIDLVALPSSSPAYTLPLADKQTAWLGLRPYLAPTDPFCLDQADSA